MLYIQFTGDGSRCCQILSHASPFAVIPDEVREKVKAYGKGVLSAWTPQQLILDHPV